MKTFKENWRYRIRVGDKKKFSVCFIEFRELLRFDYFKLVGVASVFQANRPRAVGVAKVAAAAAAAAAWANRTPW